MYIELFGLVNNRKHINIKLKIINIDIVINIPKIFLYKSYNYKTINKLVSKYFNYKFTSKNNIIWNEKYYIKLINKEFLRISIDENDKDSLDKIIKFLKELYEIKKFKYGINSNKKELLQDKLKDCDLIWL